MAVNDKSSYEPEWVKVFLDAGANMTIRDYRNRTVMDTKNPQLLEIYKTRQEEAARRWNEFIRGSDPQNTSVEDMMHFSNIGCFEGALQEVSGRITAASV